MTVHDWIQTGGFQYMILPGLIFLLRIGDVTLGTRRIFPDRHRMFFQKQLSAR